MKQRSTTDQWAIALLDFEGDQRSQGLSVLTVKDYCRRIRLFAAENPGDPWAMTTARIERWFDLKGNQGIAEATIKSHRSALRLFYRWGKNTGRTRRDPAATPKRSDQPSPDPVLDQYRVTLLAGGRARSTVNLRLSQLRSLSELHPDLLAVTRRDLLTYFADRRDTLLPNTRKSQRAAFRSFYAWALDEGLISESPAARLEPIRGVHVMPRVAPAEDVRAALTMASPRDRAILLLGRLGCLRRAEIATLKVSDRHGDVLLVLGKGGKRRRVDIPPPLMAALLVLEQAEAQEYYFPGRVDGHLRPDTVHEVVMRLTGWNTHSLRHAGATAAYKGTHDLIAVQELLGHASVATTQMYVHVEDAARRAAAHAAAAGF